MGSDSFHSSDSKICRQCGFYNDKSSNFCANCGISLNSVRDDFRNAAEDLKKSFNFDNCNDNCDYDNGSYKDYYKADFENIYMTTFIQRNNEYYIIKFQDMQSTNENTSWNWASFFLCWIWLMYRKMYLLGFVVLIINLILDLFILGWCVNIFIGFYGNSLYLKHVHKNIQEVSYLNEDAKLCSLVKRGGVNLVLPMIMFFIVHFAIFVIIAIILAGLFVIPWYKYVTI